MMSLASRHAAPAHGSTHTVLPASNSNTVTGAAGALPTSQVNDQTGNTGRRANPPLMSLFNSGICFPRRMLVQARGAQDNLQVPIHLSFTVTIGQGTFGQIERATLTVPKTNADGTVDQTSNKTEHDGSSIQVAVKRVLQDPRYKNRELSIMQRLNNHPNVVKFYYYYYSTATSNSRSHRSTSGRGGSSSSGVDVFLHLVLECFPESLCELIYRYLQRNVKIPVHIVKVFTYQMLKALAYMHSHQICHRDIKSSNLLVDESTLILKVCDFGSAKEMVPGTANVSYISSRYYRAPELLFGAQLYTCAIDTWSAGCVLAEMLRQHCLFMGGDSVDQLVKVIRVLGTPTTQDIESMNPMYGSYNFPEVQSCPVKLFFPQHTPPDLLALMSKMLVYNPTLRISPSDALGEPCFNELRELGSTGMLPNRVRMPPHLFDPDPPPSTTTASSAPPTHELNTTAGTHVWPAQDARHFHGSGSKKSGDLSGSDKKSNKQPENNRETAGDWHCKGRPSGSQTSEKIGVSDSSTRLVFNNQVNTDTCSLKPTGTSGGNSVKGGSAGRVNNAVTNYLKKADDVGSSENTSAATDGTNLSNGSSEARMPGSGGNTESPSRVLDTSQPDVPNESVSHVT
ncbi:Glycogen synthase kinase-3 alpha [Fasciola gigantica]|uniref:Glycogen synthase kinase-3 alpha n=1 Tax=Fasciola gigantica TaxID=46835 RepID=A0A504YJQ1_FASGI|nr:Glycogen synthase kinase-3 alpha [Fasciola gigantica]